MLNNEQRQRAIAIYPPVTDIGRWVVESYADAHQGTLLSVYGFDNRLSNQIAKYHNECI
jgi:hypothetical protein